MQDWRRIAHDAKDILTVCLAKAIDRAMISLRGNDWFAEFALSDAREKVSNRITKTGQTSVNDLDLQGLLKILRHRPMLTKQVLDYYGFYTGMDSFAADAQTRQLHGLLDRLINDFRNRIQAHSRAADIEMELSGQDVNRIYGYEEAVQDMYKLAKVFDNLKDSSGIAYCDKIAALRCKKRKTWQILLPVAAALVLILGLLFWKSGAPPAQSNVYRAGSTPVFTEGKVAVRPVKVYYDGQELVAVCSVTNGASKTAYNIDVYSFKVICNGQTIAAAKFGCLQEVVLGTGESVNWTFRFPANTVLVRDAKLAELETEILINHS